MNNSEELELKDEPVVLITGCSEGGIGHALARAFAAKKCRVVATSRRRSSMKELEGDARFFLQEIDVQCDESVEGAVKNVVDKYGRVDVLVNNAGIQCVGPLAEVPLSAFHQTFDTNVYGMCSFHQFFFHTLQWSFLVSLDWNIGTHQFILLLIYIILP